MCAVNSLLMWQCRHGFDGRYAFLMREQTTIGKIDPKNGVIEKIPRTLADREGFFCLHHYFDKENQRKKRNKGG